MNTADNNAELTITTAQQGLDATTLKINFTITAEPTHKIELTDPSSNTAVTKYDVDGSLISKPGAKFVAYYKVTAASWESDANYTAALADGTLASLVGNEYLVTMGVEGNVGLVTNDGSAGTYTNAATTHSFKIVVGTTTVAGDTLTIKTSGDLTNMIADEGAVKAWFRVGTNNKIGTEVLVDEGDYANSTEYDKGDMVKHGSNYYVCLEDDHTTHASKNPTESGESEYWQDLGTIKPKLHGEDKIVVASVA